MLYFRFGDRLLRILANSSQRILKAANTPSESLPQFGQLTGTEDEQGNREHENQVVG
jgi:hypothetical protein